MCGRYASFLQNQDLLDAFLIDPTLPLDSDVAQWRASWNIAPTQNVRIVVERPASAPSSESLLAPVRSLRLARWGLVPSWAKSPEFGARLINARFESALDKPSFAAAFAKRRCLIPADGFYEWLAPAAGAASRKKIPQFITRSDGGPLAFAGLYEFWRDPALPADDRARWLVSCTILTSESEGDFAAVHNRRPVVLDPQLWDPWLSPRTSQAEASALLQTTPPHLTWHPVSTRVNAVSNDDATLIRAEAADVRTGEEETLFDVPQS